jgi:hypothetical protein
MLQPPTHRDRTIRQLVFLFLVEIMMTGRMLKFRQVQERTYNVYVQQRFVILALAAELLGLVQMKSHRIDRHLHVLVTGNPFGGGGRLASRLEAKGPPVALRLLDFRLARCMSCPDAHCEHARG